MSVTMSHNGQCTLQGLHLEWAQQGNLLNRADWVGD